jgi:hypothetical protein
LTVVRLFDGGEERWSHIFPADPFDKKASAIGFEFRGLMRARVAFKAAHFGGFGSLSRHATNFRPVGQHCHNFRHG